ncbi:Acetylcholinesterase [Apiospora saccharicola]|uniref:Carboxylic ester hydrolase n=1 Tax=Apiospora saccharicola TaxID=335842 RepID=A0ABR1WH10_9PEZI
MRITSSIVAFAALRGAQGLVTRADDGLTVLTTSGSPHGFVNETAPNVRQWLGVPYAKPPVGALRFMRPQKKIDAGPIEATEYSPACMQQSSNTTTIYTKYIREFLINGGESEDCLYLNVYAPLAPTSSKLPVFVYIPGGGFTSGGSNSLYKIPDKWIERTQSHIVVVMNYRLNLFGFPSADSAMLNVGLLDQRMVVEWTRDNIAAFGGDPDKIVLWGQSAGAGSVGGFAYAHYSDPIVSGLIADSGAASMLLKTPHSGFSTLATMVGCGGGDLGKKDPEAELACMQAIDANVLEDTLSANSLSFTPVADNVTAFADTTERLARGLIAQLPLITGSNANEGAGFGAFNESGLSPGQYENGFATIGCPVSAEAHRRAGADPSLGLSTYRYEYAGNFSNISPLPWVGATHSAELPLLFGTHYEYRGNSTAFEWDMKWGGIMWPKYEPGTETMALFAEDDKVVQFVGADRVDSHCS